MKLRHAVQSNNTVRKRKRLATSSSRHCHSNEQNENDEEEEEEHSPTSSSSSSCSSSSDLSSSVRAAAAAVSFPLDDSVLCDQEDVVTNNELQQAYLDYLENKNTGILQCRIVLDANYDEVTTVFSLSPSNWFQLSSRRCWHCSRSYDETPYHTSPVPCALEMKWNSKDQLSFVVDGSFCSFACSKAWASGVRGEGNKSERTHRDPLALSHTQKMSSSSNPNAFLFRAWTGLSLEHYFQLPVALPRRLLKDYGGPLEYGEYAEHCMIQQDPSTIMIDRKYLPYPMISCRQSLLEEVSIQEMSQNLRNQQANPLHLLGGCSNGGGTGGSRTVLPQANLELNKRIQRLRARGSGLNQNEGF